MAAVHVRAMRALTREIDDTSSPVRQFLNDRFTSGLRDVQRDFRAPAPALAVPPVPASEANPGTTGAAADWLLRFLLFPHPDLHLAMAGAARYLGPRMMQATLELAELLDTTVRPYTGPVATPNPTDALILAELSDATRPAKPAPYRPATFTGPVAGSRVDKDLLARGCWALALLTEAYRSLQAANTGPLSCFRRATVTANDLLALAPPTGLHQLDQFRGVFETTLIPHLASRPGPWTIGPTFAGSTLIGGADGDLIAAGLLLDIKTTAKLSLRVTDILQVIGYGLLDFDDTYQLTSLGIFSARYSHLATWQLPELLTQLAGHQTDLATARKDFHTLLLNHQPHR